MTDSDTSPDIMTLILYFMHESARNEEEREQRFYAMKQKLLDARQQLETKCNITDGTDTADNVDNVNIVNTYNATECVHASEQANKVVLFNDTPVHDSSIQTVLHSSPDCEIDNAKMFSNDLDTTPLNHKDLSFPVSDCKSDVIKFSNEQREDLTLRLIFDHNDDSGTLKSREFCIQCERFVL